MNFNIERKRDKLAACGNRTGLQEKDPRGFRNRSLEENVGSAGKLDNGPSVRPKERRTMPIHSKDGKNKCNTPRVETQGERNFTVERERNSLAACGIRDSWHTGYKVGIQEKVHGDFRNRSLEENVGRAGKWNNGPSVRPKEKRAMPIHSKDKWNNCDTPQVETQLEMQYRNTACSREWPVEYGYQGNQYCEWNTYFPTWQENISAPPTTSAVTPTASAVTPTASAVTPTASAVTPTASAVTPTASAVTPTASAATNVRSTVIADVRGCKIKVDKNALVVHAPRYKTELCKSYEASETCRYGEKCLYAHGEEELRSIPRHPKYKTELCHTFYRNGLCSYGVRCNFIHNPDKSKKDAMCKVISSELTNLVNGLSLTQMNRFNSPQVDMFISPQMIQLDLPQIYARSSLGSDGEASPSSSGCGSPTEFNNFLMPYQ